ALLQVGKSAGHDRRSRRVVPGPNRHRPHGSPAGRRSGVGIRAAASASSVASSPRVSPMVMLSSRNPRITMPRPPVPGDDVAVHARADVDMNEIAAIAADAAKLALAQRPGMKVARAHPGNSDIGGHAADVLRVVAATTPATALVAVDRA